MSQASRGFQAQISPRRLIGYETTWGLIEIAAVSRVPAAYYRYQCHPLIFVTVLPISYPVLRYSATSNPFLNTDTAPSGGKSSITANVSFRETQFCPGMTGMKRLAAHLSHGVR
jgi:hypothetical protein